MSYQVDACSKVYHNYHVADDLIVKYWTLTL